MALRANKFVIKAVATLMAIGAFAPAHAADHASASLQVTLTVLSVCTVGSAKAPAANMVASSFNVNCSEAVPYRLAVSGDNQSSDRSGIGQPAVQQAVLQQSAPSTAVTGASDQIQHVVATVTF